MLQDVFIVAHNDDGLFAVLDSLGSWPARSGKLGGVAETWCALYGQRRYPRLFSDRPTVEKTMQHVDENGLGGRFPRV
jgi:hypothetical protein